MTTPAKIEPWLTETAAYIQAEYNLLYESISWIAAVIANDIAAHAPQEPSVPVIRLLQLQQAALDSAGSTAENFWKLIDEAIRQAEQEKQP